MTRIEFIGKRKASAARREGRERAADEARRRQARAVRSLRNPKVAAEVSEYERTAHNFDILAVLNRGGRR